MDAGAGMGMGAGLLADICAGSGMLHEARWAGGGRGRWEVIAGGEVFILGGVHEVV